MTLNAIIALFCIISPNSIAFKPDYVKVVEDRPIISAEYSLPLMGKTDPSCNAVSLR